MAEVPNPSAGFASGLGRSLAPPVLRFPQCCPFAVIFALLGLKMSCRPPGDRRTWSKAGVACSKNVGNGDWEQGRKDLLSAEPGKWKGKVLVFSFSSVPKSANRIFC